MKNQNKTNKNLGPRISIKRLKAAEKQKDNQLSELTESIQSSIAESSEQNPIKEKETFVLKPRICFNTRQEYDQHLLDRDKFNIMRYIKREIDDFDYLLIPHHWEEMMIDWPELREIVTPEWSDYDIRIQLQKRRNARTETEKKNK